MKPAGTFFSGLMLTLFLCGCYRSGASLERKNSAPAQRRTAVKKAPAVKKSRQESVDPAFDMIFKSKPQKHENSIVSDSDQDYIHKNQQSDAASIRTIRRERLQENTKQKDWVFGTKDGKYF